MATKKKLLQAAAGSAGGAGLNVEDVFSTYLYEGNQSTKTITNNIDLSGEGGLVWIKNRDVAYKHALFDTERGTTKLLSSNLTNATVTESGSITSFNSNGFTLGSWGVTNGNNEDHASWTFRKAPKFFDVITYSGNGSNQTISHNLGSTPGMIVVKARNNSDDAWYVWHRSLPQFGTQAQYRSVVFLDSTSAYSNYSIQTAQPDNSNIYVGSDWSVSGYDYVMYVFAHNDGDGEFGPDGDADIIKCGSFTTDSSGDASVDIGFEPQWIIYKRSDGTSNWGMNDNMRGWADTYWNPLYADASNAESGFASTRSWPTATGFEFEGQLSASANYIYIAIRRGPMAVPEDATDVFAMDFRFSSEAQALNPEHQYYSGFPVDMHLNLRRSGGGVYAYSRLQGGSNFLRTSTTDAEVSSTTNQFGSNEGLYPLGFTNTEDTTTLGHMFRRAPNFFDVVAYTGNGTAGRTVSHNLGVAPEMMWVKNRDQTQTWAVYHKDLDATSPEDYYLQLQTTNARINTSAVFGAQPTDSVFTVDVASSVNQSGQDIIAYLFASLDGVSKVGSYTGNGSLTGPSIDCGFSAGPRFVLIKRTDSGENWYMFDSERGIVAGADPYLMLNSTSAEINAGDIIDPTSSGFQLATNGSSVNASGGTYIFYAIA